MPTITINDIEDAHATEIANLEEACSHLAGVRGVIDVPLGRDCSRDVLLYLLSRPGSCVRVYGGTDPDGRTWRQAGVRARVCGVVVDAIRAEGQPDFDLLVAAKAAEDAARSAKAAA